jgi:hypothetical protein
MEGGLFYDIVTLKTNQENDSMKFRIFTLLIICISLLYSACSGGKPAPAITSTPGQQEPSKAYPAPLLETTRDYPPPAVPTYANTAAPTVDKGYPIPPTPKQGPKANVAAFKLDKPIVEGATEITGKGPATVPISIYDVTFFGVLLGSTVINEDGSFSLKVPPLEKGHRVGISLGDLAGTKWSESSFDDRGFFGEEALQVPNVGFFYDTAMVQGK